MVKIEIEKNISKYSLQEFNTWLNLDQKRKRCQGKNWWEISNEITTDELLKKLVEGENIQKQFGKRIPYYSYDKSYWSPYQQIALRWVFEIALYQSEIPLKNLSNLLFINQNYDFIKLKGEVIRLKVGKFSPQVRTEKAELEKMITKIRDKLIGTNLDKVLELYLQTSQKAIQEKKEKDSFVKGQLAVFGELLQEKINLEELQILFNKKKTFLELENHLTKLQNQLLNLGEAQIQNENNYDDYEYEITNELIFYEKGDNEVVSFIEKKPKLPTQHYKVEISAWEKLTELFHVFFPNEEYNFEKLEQEIKKLKFADLSPQVQQDKNRLERLITSSKNKVGNQSEKFLELLLKLHQKAVEEKKETEPFVEGQLSACSSLLSETLTESELQQLLTQQKKVTQLEKQLTNLQITKEQTTQQRQAQIQVLPKQNQFA